LNELRTILFVVQNRLEMGAGGLNSSRKMPRTSRSEMARNSRSSPQDQAHERRLAQVKLREGNSEIEWTFLRQGKRVTARLRFAAQRKPFEDQGKKSCPDVTVAVRLWPRVEMSRSFLLRELRHILHIWQNRVEMQTRSSKSMAWF
jgi:hypothetical protein